MLYRHHIDACFGSGGAERSRFDAALARLKPAIAALKNGTHQAASPILAVAAKSDDLAAITGKARDIASRFAHVVVLGSGGSGLSGRTLATLKLGALKPTLHFLETIDPDAVAAVLKDCPASDTHTIVISKSGTTAETLAQFYAMLARAKTAIKGDLSKHFTLITTTGDNPLRRAAAEYGFTVLDHADNIGGRFSVLTNVGLLPAAIAGLDIAKLRKGALSVVKALSDDCASAKGAALHMAFMEQRVPISVFMPYGERLSALAAWWRQGFAESLGKGGKGATPIRAMGTTDQHSQLQLYLDGPKDKFFTLLTLARDGTGQAIDAPRDHFLHGKTTGDLMAAEQKATVETLIRHGRPVRHIELGELGEEHMGALLMHFMIEIILIAELMGINAFDQPAVEEGKRLAETYLKKGAL